MRNKKIDTCSNFSFQKRNGAVMQDNRIHVDVPRKIIHSKSDEIRITDNGAVFVWVDVSAAVKLDGYGFWFPSWLLRENLEYCTLIIEREYKSNYTGQILANTFTVEHKEKIKGKFSRLDINVKLL